MGNKYYKLLIMFQRGERVTRDRLLKLNGINEELIDECLALGYLTKYDETDIGQIRYVITEKGIQKRDN